jgi:hypothetical protein
MSEIVLPSVRAAIPARPGRILRRTTLADVWVFLAVSLPVVAALAARLQLTDLAYQLRAGEIMLRHHAVLRVDPFTFTHAGQPWLNQQWGSEVVFWILYRAGGWAALIVTRAGLLGATCALVYLSCRAVGASKRRSAGLTLGGFVVAATSGSSFALRPQLVAMALFSLTLFLVCRRREHASGLWLIPAITIVWANVHGSFFLAPALLALAWFEESHTDVVGRRRLLLVAATCVGAACVTPYGWRVWGYALSLATNPIVSRFVSEWRPPTIRDISGVAFFASLAAVVVVLASVRKPIGWGSLIWLGFFALLGLAAVRGIVWWTLAVPPVLAGLPVDVREGRRTDVANRTNGIVVVAVAVLVLSLLPWWRSANPIAATNVLGDAPVRATRALDLSVPVGSRVFAPVGWGSWLELALPGRPVFVDSRIELFSRGVWGDYQTVSFAQEGWGRVLDRWNVDVLVVDPATQGDLARSALRAHAWSLSYRDSQTMVFARAAARSEPRDLARWTSQETSAVSVR